MVADLLDSIMNSFIRIQDLQLLILSTNHLEFVANSDYVLFMFSCVTWLKLIIFESFYYIVTFIISSFSLAIFACSICICFYQINWLHSFIIIWTEGNLVKFFSQNIMLFTFKSLLYFLWILYVFFCNKRN